MNEYRKKMDELRAPDSLRAQTLKAIAREQLKEEEEEHQKHPKRIWMPLVTLAAAACLVLVIGLSGGRGAAPELVYHTVPSTVIRSLPQASSSMTEEQYSAYLGLEIGSLVDGELIKSEITADYEGEALRQEEGAFYYNVKGAPVTLWLSKTKEVAPESLAGKEACEVKDLQVIAAVSQDGTERMAAFEWGGIRCFLLSREMEQQDFEQLLQDLIVKFKK